MASCNPWELAEQLPCYRCFNPVMSESVAVALLEEIADGGPTPSGSFEAIDSGQRVTTDDGKNIILNI